MQIVPKITEPEYRKINALSQTALGWYQQHPLYYKSQIHKSSDKYPGPALIIGSAVDCLLTTPLEYTAKYHVDTVPSLSPEMKRFVEAMYEMRDVNLPDEQVKYETAKSLAGYNAPLKSILNLYYKDTPQEYYAALERAGNKTLISKENNVIVQKVVKDLRNSPHAWLFVPRNDEELTVMHQVPFVDEDGLNGVPIKGLLDILVINHVEKTITPYDLKTTGKSVLNFDKSFVDLGYDNQAALYYYMAAKMLDLSSLEIDQESREKLKKYTVTGFNFIVAEKQGKNNPMLWTLSPEKINEFLYVSKPASRFSISQTIEFFKKSLDQNIWEDHIFLIESNYTDSLDLKLQKC